MRTDIIEYLQKEVYHRCKQPTNKFGMGCYYHIEAVVKNAEILAEKYGADKETVIIAAWLHDIASITDYAMYEEHHKYGADIAKEILNELNYDKEKTALVQKCILKCSTKALYELALSFPYISIVSKSRKTPSNICNNLSNSNSDEYNFLASISSSQVKVIILFPASSMQTFIIGI